MGEADRFELAPFELAAMNAHHRFFSLPSFFSAAARNGYRSVELWTGPQHFFIDHAGNDPIEMLIRLADRFGVEIIGICPEQTNPKPGNMAARGGAAQARVLAYFERAIELARSVRARHVVVTSGWAFLDEPREEAWERSVAMLGRLARHAGERGMILAIEALQPHESVLANSAADLERLIDRVGEDALRVCLDIGAATRAGDSVEDYFERFGAMIVHSHFVDADEQTTHLAWGDGARDMVADLRAFARGGYHGALSVESIDARYFARPAAADAASMESFRRSCIKLGWRC